MPLESRVKSSIPPYTVFAASGILSTLKCGQDSTFCLVFAVLFLLTVGTVEGWILGCTYEHKKLPYTIANPWSIKVMSHKTGSGSPGLSNWSLTRYARDWISYIPHISQMLCHRAMAPIQWCGIRRTLFGPEGPGLSLGVIVRGSVVPGRSNSWWKVWSCWGMTGNCSCLCSWKHYSMWIEAQVPA